MATDDRKAFEKHSDDLAQALARTAGTRVVIPDSGQHDIDPAELAKSMREEARRRQSKAKD